MSSISKPSVVIPKISGATIFTNSTNNINLLNIGDRGLEIGDVVTVTGSSSNNKDFTVEVITDANNIIVNQAHADGTTTKSLVDETVSATVTLFARAGKAEIGAGQGWVNVTSSRSVGSVATNNTGRSFQLGISAGCIGNHNIDFEINGDQVAGSAASGTAMNLTFNHIINKSDTYEISTFTGQNFLTYFESR